MRYLTLDMYREELHILDPFSIFPLSVLVARSYMTAM